jgi:hypothetical protein
MQRAFAEPKGGATGRVHWFRVARSYNVSQATISRLEASPALISSRVNAMIIDGAAGATVCT